jgi:hypothetical protein
VAATQDTRVRIELRRALRQAGVTVDVDADHYHLDLSELDHHALVQRRQAALQTTASLLFSVDTHIAISAKLPLEPKSRRILSATGLMFALVEHSAVFEESTETEAPANEVDALFPISDLLRLSTFDSWRTTFTPFDPGLRQLRLGSGKGLGAGEVTHRSLREIGVYDKDLSAFVNPHHLPPSTAIQDIAQMAEPWLFKLLDDERNNADKVVSVALELLEHALDNVREHAFGSQPGKRSLVTVGQVEVGDRQMFRLQIMDNGVGIPASLSSQINEAVSDRARAEHLVSLAVEGNTEDDSPLLPWGRGQGLPRMRELSAQVDGILTIATRGPSGSQILITCEGDRPSQPYSDLVPVAGTVVTLLVPTQEPSIAVDEPISELSDV